MRLAWEERHSLAHNITNQLEELYLEENKEDLQVIEDYKQKLLDTMPHAKKLLALLDRALEVEKELKELSAKYVEIKDEAQEILIDVEGIQYVYPEVYAVRYAIFDSNLFISYINLILKNKVKQLFGDIFFKKDKIKKTVVGTLYRLEKEYTDVNTLINRVLYELRDVKFNIKDNIKDNKDEQHKCEVK
jgi:hypothetical protein